MKYEVGDKVRTVKKADWIQCRQLLDSIVTIKEVLGHRYIIEEAEQLFYDNDFVGLAEEEYKTGERVLVRDKDDEERKERIYFYTIHGRVKTPFVCIGNNDKESYHNGLDIDIFLRGQIKKLPKEEKKISIELTTEQLEKVKIFLDLNQ